MATDEIKKGDAVIRCCVEGKVKEYKIRITKTDKHTKEENKGLEIKVTDPELLEITGGIIQGMSGAPILQNGKIAGAVTHVFVNDPARGYGFYRKYAETCRIIRILSMQVRFLRQHFLVRKLQELYNKTRHDY